jgi:hypothetical protein
MRRITFYVLRFCVRDVLQWAIQQVATTDAERAAWDVPPLAEALAYAETMTCDNPPHSDKR